MEQNRSRKICRNSNKKGVPKEKIYLEKESTNTGDNFRFTKKIIEKANLKNKNMHSSMQTLRRKKSICSI